jgi:hypothetical protein
MFQTWRWSDLSAAVTGGVFFLVALTFYYLHFLKKD